MIVFVVAASQVANIQQFIAFLLYLWPLKILILQKHISLVSSSLPRPIIKLLLSSRLLERYKLIVALLNATTIIPLDLKLEWTICLDRCLPLLFGNLQFFFENALCGAKLHEQIVRVHHVLHLLLRVIEDPILATAAFALAAVRGDFMGQNFGEESCAAPALDFVWTVDAVLASQLVLTFRLVLVLVLLLVLDHGRRDKHLSIFKVTERL